MTVFIELKKTTFTLQILALICLSEHVSELCSHGCLFYMAHTAQFGPMLAAVIVAPQQALADARGVNIMTTAALHLALGVQQVFEDSSSKCARLGGIFQFTIQGG